MNKTGRLRVAALMPCLNEEASVDSTLSSLFAGSRLPDEVIVADGGSSDTTLEKIEAWREKGFPIKVVANEKVFPGAGRNAAAAASSADVFVSVDFGNTFDPGYIASMAAPFEENPEVGVVAGTFVPKPTSPLERVIALIDYHQNLKALELPPEKLKELAPEDSKHVPGGSVAWRRDLYEQAGGQPDWLRAAEDLLFGHRVLTYAPRFALQLEAHTYHHMRADILSYFRMRKTYALGRMRAGLATRALLKRRLFFLGTLALLLSSVANLWLLPIGLGAAGLWIWRNIVSFFLVSDGRLPGPADFARGLAVTVTREVGTLMGMAQGFADWVTDPKWRTARDAYLPRDKRMASTL